LEKVVSGTILSRLKSFRPSRFSGGEGGLRSSGREFRPGSRPRLPAV
jgi:hypothetical protein